MTADLTGRVYGRMTIIGPADQDPPLPQVANGWWLARCQCSRELIAPSEAFTAGRVTSCGRRTSEQRAELEETIASYHPAARW